MKVAPVFRALAKYAQVPQTIVHTGDFNVSDVFFQELGLPAPDFNLEAGSGSHAQQTSQIIARASNPFCWSATGLEIQNAVVCRRYGTATLRSGSYKS